MGIAHGLLRRASVDQFTALASSATGLILHHVREPLDARVLEHVLNLLIALVLKFPALKTDVGQKQGCVVPP